ncbi:MAG: methyltransferase domain-containing protein [Gemmatimonadota bacterium]|nr:methyltransferase domain-containing protein [Gemmatimonadota bacterium]
MKLESGTPLYVPPLHVFENDGISYAIDHDAPNWVAVDSRGRGLLDVMLASHSGTTLRELTARYGAQHGLDTGTAWVHVHDFLAALDRAGMVSDQPTSRDPYPGRAALIAPDGLRELWIQINNACNLTCTHCLVSSGPGKEYGLPSGQLHQLVAHAAELGLERLYLTGGEPFVRRDVTDLIQRATGDLGLDVIVLTNGTVFRGPIRDRLTTLDRDTVRLQISIDGVQPSTNDAIRGAGTLNKALDGARLASDLGFDVSLSTVVARENLTELSALPDVARSVGAKSFHLMWAHRRGRAAASRNGFFPEIPDLVAAVDESVAAAQAADVELDNLEAMKRRVNGVPGIKYDLGNGAWDSIAVYVDGGVYPTAALVNEPTLLCGNLTETRLGDILNTSPVVRRLRAASVAQKTATQNDAFRFFTGGGDWEHAWWATGDHLGADPYYPVAVHLAKHVMTALGREKSARRNTRSGYAAPLVLHAMGQGAIACGSADAAAAQQPVLTLHSNCVLSFDVDKPRAAMREFYGAAADQPQAALCCPTKYDDSAVAHIPQDVLDRFYGCGSPMTSANIEEGEIVVDLGSGAGIDVFIAAKYVGPEGKAIGIDMTDRMLEVARDNQPKVAAALGYDVVDFREGYLESIPVETKSVNLVTSNCVVNLSPDKPRVFEEIWRVLKDHGRIVISDIVSEREVPAHLKTNVHLWGECLSGALTQQAFLAELERAGFYGLSVRNRTHWKDVEGYAFFSVTVEGFKYEKQAGCVFDGHRAVYLGPGKAFVDEEGHLFPRNEPFDVCTDTVAKLQRPPYEPMFAILEPGDEVASYACCSPDDSCC